MGKTKKNKKSKVGFLDFNNMRIQQRLKNSYTLVLAIASVAAVIGAIAVFIVATNYKSAMDNYALPQGDIGKMLQCVADCRSATRGIIGYESDEQRATLIESHDSYKIEAYAYLDLVKPTMVTPEGHAAMAKIEAALEAYYEVEAKVIALGTENGGANKVAAQELAIKEMAPAYTALYEALDDLMTVNVQKANEMDISLNILQLAMIILIVVVIVLATIISKRISNDISKGIADPLNDLANRLKDFAAGDVSSEFPVITSKDKIADMMEEASGMAEKFGRPEC